MGMYDDLSLDDLIAIANHHSTSPYTGYASHIARQALKHIREQQQEIARLERALELTRREP